MIQHRFFPVVHIKDFEQTISNVDLCVNNEVDGVFLIHHRKDYRTLLNIAALVHKCHPSLWIGLNALDLSAEEAIVMVPEWAGGVWVDNCGIREHKDSIITDGAHLITAALQDRNSKIELFGGFAFKYQEPFEDLELGARIASLYLDVVTTSGDGTGIAADINKIRRIANGMMAGRLYGNRRLAIASGITPENINEYIPYAQDFLVATGISKDEYNFDEEKLKRVKDAIKEP